METNVLLLVFVAGLSFTRIQWISGITTMKTSNIPNQVKIPHTRVKPIPTDKDQTVTDFAAVVHCANVLNGARTNRILDGDIASPGEFPYAVSIQTGGLTETRGHRCGGVLITLQHVVTVASCLYNTNPITGNSELINPAEYRVFAGANSLADQSGDRVRSIANFTVHPDYTGMPALVNNIAIVTLVVPFLAGIVTPLSLPSNPDPVEFTLCTVAGWGGNNATNQASVQLRYFTKYVYGQKECTRVYNSIPGIKNILPSMICAVSHNLQSSNCGGDEGNALVCNNRLTGVLSLSDDCSKSTLPEVYTRISNYTTWIRSVSGSGSVFSANIFALIGFFSFIQIYFNM